MKKKITQPDFPGDFLAKLSFNKHKTNSTVSPYWDNKEILKTRT